MTDPMDTTSAQDRRALFLELVEDHAWGIYRFLTSHAGSPMCAEDLTQETYLRAYRHLDALRDPSKARSWLFAIAANVAREDGRRRSRRPDGPPENEWRGREAVQDSPAAKDHELDLSAVLARLNEDDRIVLLLAGQAGLSMVEVGAVLGIRTDAARKRWQRACARFRNAFDDEGGAQ